MQNHHHHHHFQPKALLPISFISSNGRMIKTTTAAAKDSGGNGDQHKYRECLKNHAASLGGHALDGCMEFMLSPTSTVSRPSSLTCAACGCHRNFHRRIPLLNQQEENGEGELEDEEDPFGSSGPHMLMALSAGGRTRTTTTTTNTNTNANTNTTPRKRFRTKFSKEQKEKMQELAVRLGWGMLKRDEGLVEEWCSEIGVSKHVFKVWMHNNKNSFRIIINTTNTTDSNGNHGVLPLLMGNGNNGCGLVSSPSTS